MRSIWHSPLVIASKTSKYEAISLAASAKIVAHLLQPIRIFEVHFLNIEVEAMKFRPLHDRVVVRRLEEDAKTAGGIIIPDTAKEKPIQGEVIAAGPGLRGENGQLVPLDVKKGDRVLFGKWSGSEVKIDGEELAIMKESDIFGVIEGK